jgi:hypothetical protein
MSATALKRPSAPGLRSYGCPSREVGPETCGARANITDSIVEPHVEALFWQELERTRASNAHSKVRAARAGVERLEEVLCGYRDNLRIAQTLGASRYEEGLRVRRRAVEKALLRLHAARRNALARPGS